MNISLDTCIMRISMFSPGVGGAGGGWGGGVHGIILENKKFLKICGLISYP